MVNYLNRQYGHSPEGAEETFSWFRLWPFVLIHGMCLGVIWVGWSWPAVIVCVLMYVLRMFAITGFYHRYFSHRTFKTSRFFQFVFAVWGTTAAQRGPLWWAAHHRHHHRHSDKPEDVHSPHSHSLLWSHMLWITAPSNSPTEMKAVRDLAKYPELRLLNKYDVWVPVAMSFAMFYLGMAISYYFPQSGTSAMQMLIWGFFVSTVLLFHGTSLVNSMAHLVGRRRYETGDHSRNSLLLALLTLGEGWHNNHHFYPASTRQGFFWYEIDITYYVLKMMSFLGIIWDLKPVPAHVRANTRSAGARADGYRPGSPLSG